MADKNTPLFSTGFPMPQPSPAELAGLSMRVAIPQGVMQGIAQAGQNAVDQAMSGPMVLADSLVDGLVQPVQEGLGNVGIVQQQLAQVGQQAAVNAIQAPLLLGSTMGYQSQGTPLINDPRRSKSRARKGKQAQAQNPVQPAPSAGMVGTATMPSPLQKPGSTAGGAVGPTLPAPGGGCPPGWWIALNPVSGLVGYFPSQQAASDAVRNSQPQLNWGPGTIAPPMVTQCPGAQGAGGAVGPTLPMGGGAQGTKGVFPIGPVSPPPLAVPPLPPSPPSPCPCPNISILVPLPQQPAPNINITVPPCPNCGQQGQPVLFPLPMQGPIVMPAPNVTVNVPDCKNCGGQIPPIVINIPPQGSSARGGGVVPTGQGATPPILPGGASPEQCPTCSIPYLCLNYPQFVLASKAARKSDFDILTDAINLGLCCGLPQFPACSMPLLMREFPDFVAAGKAQGLSDDQVLQQAVNVGLCADIAVSTGLGESAVGYLAPGSASELAAEFDPQTAGEAPSRTRAALLGGPTSPFTDLLGNVLGGLLGSVPAVLVGALSSGIIGESILAAPGQGDTSECPAPLFRVDLSGIGQGETPDEITACLGGLARPAVDLVAKIVKLLTAECQCDDASLTSALTAVSAQLLAENSVWSRVGGFILRFIVSGWRTGICFERDLANALKDMTGCELEIGVPAMIAQGITQLLGRWAPILPAPLVQSINQLANWSCPVNPPSAAEANALRATGWISDQSWECMIRANGFRPEQQIDIVAAQRRRPSDEEVLMLERKQAIKPERIAEHYAHNGWTGQQALADWKIAQQWVASPSDVIDWMIKDVQDEQITNTFLTRAEFKQKYTGHVKDVFNWNGIAENDALAIWQAHWRNMAPTTLYELHKRLRPGWTLRFSDQQALDFAMAICPRRGSAVTDQIAADRPNSNGWPVPTYCDEVSTSSRARDYLESLVTSGYHVSEALGQADYPPFWRQRLLALSYRALNRTDLRTAYVQGSLTPDRLLGGLQDVGYFIDDALSLQRQDTFQAILRFTKFPACTQYIRWGGDLALVEIDLLSEGMAPWMWTYVQYLIGLRRLLRVEQQFLRAIQAQFLKGQQSATQARNALGNYQRSAPTPPPALGGFPALAKLPGQLEQQAIDLLLKEWQLIKQTTPKQETAAQICTEFKAGLITGRQAQLMLQNLNYAGATARRILSLCYLRKLPSTMSTMPAPGSKDFAAMQQALDS